MSTSSGTSRCGTSTVNRGFSSHSHLSLSPSVVKPGHLGAHSTLVWQVTSSTEVTPSRPRSHPGKPARPFWHNRERNCLPAPHLPWQPDQLDHWLHNGATNCFITFFKLFKTYISDKRTARSNQPCTEFASDQFPGRVVPLQISSRSFRTAQDLVLIVRIGSVTSQLLTCFWCNCIVANTQWIVKGKVKLDCFH